MPRVSVNTLAPEFELLDFNGKKVKLSDFSGKHSVVMIFNRGFY